MISMVQNDVIPILEATFQNDDGSAIDLTTSTEVRLFIAEKDFTLKANRVMTIMDAVNGKASYSWQAGDLDTPGKFWMQFQITFNDGSKRSVPNDPVTHYEELVVIRELG